MAFGQIEILARDAVSSDLSDPVRSARMLTKIFGSNLSAHETFTATQLAAVTLDLAHLCDGASSNQVIFVNKDTTNFVTITWDDFDNAGNTGRLGKGAAICLSDVDGGTALTLQADTDDCIVEMFVLSEA